MERTDLISALRIAATVSYDEPHTPEAQARLDAWGALADRLDGWDCAEVAVLPS